MTAATIAERDAEIARLRAETIRKAAAMVPEWRPWMRQWVIDTDWGTRLTLEEREAAS